MPKVPRFGWRTIAAATVLALIAAVGTYSLLGGSDRSSKPTDAGKVADGLSLTPDTGKGATDPNEATFTTFDGKPVKLSSLHGTPTVVNFFASTCVPCITEMPALEAVHQKAGTQVRFLGLAVSDRTSEAKKLVKRTKVTYETAQDHDGSVIEALGGTILPTTVLLDANGKIVATHNGAITSGELTTLLADDFGVHT